VFLKSQNRLMALYFENLEWFVAAALMIGLWLLYLWFFGIKNTNNYLKSHIVQWKSPGVSEQIEVRQNRSNRSVWRQVFSLLGDEVKQLQREHQKLHSSTKDWIHRTNSDLILLRNAINKLQPTPKTAQNVRRKRLSLHPSMSLAFSIQDGNLRI